MKNVHLPAGTLCYELGLVIMDNKCVLVNSVLEGCSASDIHVSAFSPNRSIILSKETSITCNAN